jgi:hypothetical protein
MRYEKYFSHAFAKSIVAIGATPLSFRDWQDDLTARIPLIGINTAVEWLGHPAV